MKYSLSILLSLFLFSEVFGQLGGVGNFEFLNLTPSARSSALGGYFSMLRDDDVSLGLSNPAALNQSMWGKLAINHNFHISDINYGNIHYATALDSSLFTVAIGAQYISYGDFRRTDFRDQDLGEFGGSEYAIRIGAAVELQERLSIGSTIKVIRSSLDSYQSTGLGIDIGIQYLKPENRSAWSFLLSNVGWQLSSNYTSDQSLPFNIQLGYTKELEHVPFKLLITMRDLQRWDLRQELATDDPIFINQPSNERSSLSIFTDNLFRHLVFGGEFVLGQKEAVRLRFGYNHQRNQELKSSVFRSFSGFSFGFGLKLKKFRLDYGVGVYHLAGGVNNLSLTIDLFDLNRVF